MEVFFAIYVFCVHGVDIMVLMLRRNARNVYVSYPFLKTLCKYFLFIHKPVAYLSVNTNHYGCRMLASIINGG